ncbi:hypothetical protein D9619_007138 [Psilocybe cf. subviscida]|uniref:Heme oxygenase n=1 Tax=Psilocybe cf. subviscida TaxID=2480587 RepID=A0A8H5B3I9_9AGAR|nr:hypothetical protein D9619_007138 [Psilocybe cf. subviscida]
MTSRWKKRIRSTPPTRPTTMSSIDYSKTLAALLRESTMEAHDEVATSTGAKRLLSGELSRDEYTRYLMMLWHVYDSFERALERHATHPTLEPTYNPALLARAPALSADIAHLLDVTEAGWQTHPIHKQLIASPPVPLAAYVSRIESVAASADPSALLAHSYVRYMGDLSGGQTIRHTLAKAYELDEAAGEGISFYAFKELRSAKAANQGEMKRIKEWFREGMNKAGEQGAVVKAAVVEEARTAFVLNAGLFTVLDFEEPSEGIKGDLQVNQLDETSLSEKSFSLSSVIAFTAALCLAHFVIVVGGLSGDKGYQKLLALEQWARTLIASD